MEPSYGFGSRLAVNTDGYSTIYSEGFPVPELMNLKKRSTLILVE